MAIVVFVRGLNVGGHRTFQPTELATQLQHLDAVNIGATGTIVIRRPVGRAALRDEIARRLPFAAEIAICAGRDIVRLVSQDVFAGYPTEPDLIRFVSVLSRRPRSSPALPLTFPPGDAWLVKVLARDGRFVVGMHRRDMKVIGYLGKLDAVFGVPATTRNWNTMVRIADVLRAGTT